MKKAGITVMVLAAIIMVVSGIAFNHSITDNVVDSGGFWAYMYGMFSVPWVLYSGGVIFFMGLTVFFSGMEQKSARY